MNCVFKDTYRTLSNWLAVDLPLSEGIKHALCIILIHSSDRLWNYRMQLSYEDERRLCIRREYLLGLIDSDEYIALDDDDFEQDPFPMDDSCSSEYFMTGGN